MTPATLEKKFTAASERIGGYKGALAFLEQFPNQVARRVLKPAMQAADLVGKNAIEAEARRHASDKPKRHGVHLCTTAGAVEAASGTRVIAKVGYFGEGGSHGWLVRARPPHGRGRYGQADQPRPQGLRQGRPRPRRKTLARAASWARCQSTPSLPRPMPSRRAAWNRSSPRR